MNLTDKAEWCFLILICYFPYKDIGVYYCTYGHFPQAVRRDVLIHQPSLNVVLKTVDTETDLTPVINRSNVRLSAV